MKKTFLFYVPLLLSFVACENVFRDEITELHREIDEIRSQVDVINSDIAALESIVTALQNNDYVLSVDPVIKDGAEIGYTINFSKSGAVTVYHGKDGIDGETGKDGYSPMIGLLKEADGNWYWTLDGAWLLDSDGNKIKANGNDGVQGEHGEDAIAPELKIEEGYWYVSSNAGVTWTKIGKATGEDGDTFFESIDASSPDYVMFNLKGGTQIVIPRYKSLSISLNVEDDGTSIGGGETLPIRYSIDGGTSDVVITASSDGYFKTSVSKIDDRSGIVHITCPGSFQEGYVNLIVSDGCCQTVYKVIKLYERSIKFYDGLLYHLGPYGGQIEIPYTSNFDYSLNFSDGCDAWIDCIRTKASSYSGQIVLDVSPNNLTCSRVAHVNIMPSNNAESSYMTIEIDQSSAYFDIDQSGYTVPSAGDEFDVNMSSSRGVMISPSEYDWTDYSLDSGEDTYTLHVKIDRNFMDEERLATIPIYTGDGVTEQGTILIRQLGKNADAQMDMILEVSANEINHYTVYLPIAGECKCYVDWGDGTIDHIEGKIDRDKNNEYLKHVYANELKHYYVSIAGKVSTISSKQMPDRNGIRKVIQWGNLNLSDVSWAFYGCSSLSEIAGDTMGAFSNITDFSYMFEKCASLETIPEDLFFYATKATTFEKVFSECLSLHNPPEQLFANCLEVRSFNSSFSICKNLTSVPERLFASCPQVTDFSGVFGSCHDGLLEIPAKIFSWCPEVVTFDGAFGGTYLTSIPVSLFDNNRKVTNFHCVFWQIGKNYCPEESPYTIIDGVKYHLYDRIKDPDLFSTPNDYGGCFGTCVFADTDVMPAAWQS